jgi:methyltransferase
MGVYGGGGGGDMRDDDGASFDVVAEAPGVPRKWTVSIALPGSILDNAQSPELRAALACQVARAAAIFCVDEVIVFREGARAPRDDATDDLALLLAFLDTPQYLRRHLFPHSDKLRLVGLLNPLNLPNHFAKADTPRWRDGVAVPLGAPHGRGARGGDGAAPAVTRFVDVGLPRLAEVDHQVPLGERVTVDLAASGEGYSVPGKHCYGQVVRRSEPRELDGLYWGYSVRVADSLLEALSGGGRDWAGGGEEGDDEASYDLVIGTSERGTPVRAPLGAKQDAPFGLPEFSHALIVFGGVRGLEHSAQCDERLVKEAIGGEGEGARPVDDLFDFYVNTCPDQGSRTIRTEEAIPISLANLQPFLRPVDP